MVPETGLGPFDLPDIITAWTALQGWPHKPEKRFRTFDGRTPVAVHSLHAATLIAMEPELPAAVRYLLARLALLHDVQEDTPCGLPYGVHPELIRLVGEMSFPGGTAQEFGELFDRDPLVWVAKLYDKYSNLYDGLGHGGWMESRGPGYAQRYLDFTLNLLDRVEREVLPRLSPDRVLKLKIMDMIRVLRV